MSVRTQTATNGGTRGAPNGGAARAAKGGSGADSLAVAPGAEGREGERSEPESPVAEGATAAASPLEVVVRRRRFSAAFKQRIVKEAAAVSTTGGVSALLRREGIYSSHLAEWRKAAAAGLFVAGQEPKQGRPSKDGLSPTERRFEKENARLRERLRQAELIIEFQKKVAALLDQLSPTQSE